MTKKSSETVEEVLEIIRETLVEVASALADRKSNGEGAGIERDAPNLVEAASNPPPADPIKTETEAIEPAMTSEAGGGIGPLAAKVVQTFAPRNGEAIEREGAAGSAAPSTAVDRLVQMLDPMEQMDLLEPEPVPAYIPQKLPTINMHRTLWKVVVTFAVILVLINLPLPVQGGSIARMIPDAKSLIIRQGLIFKSENAPEVYILNEKLEKRWITDIEAFDFYDIRWQQVNIVDDPFVAQFPDGEPLYVLTKCNGSPHVYALEAGQKRWIKDIPTFEAQNFEWEQIMPKSCAAINRIPDGPPIPEDAGEPPRR